MSNLERLESVKAGVLGAITFIIPYFLTLRLHDVLWEYTPIPPLTLGLKLAIALISGFLFGVTYRYIIRNETNSHLKDGAVFAFGLIRGLVPLEMSPQVLDSLGEISILGIESILCFAIVRFSIDFALHRHWIKPFLLMSQPDLTITLKLFAAYQEAYGISQISRNFPSQTTVKAVLETLIEEHPELEKWREVTRFGVNFQFVEADILLQDGDEVVFIPPVSGG